MIDVIYLAWNRLELTRLTFPLLLRNTDWSLVRNLIVYEDGSTDGTREYLDGALSAYTTSVRFMGIDNAPMSASLSYLGYGSPVRTMNHYLERDPAPLFAKVDSDIAVPPGWLNELAAVMGRSPELEILGMQAGFTGETLRADAHGVGYSAWSSEARGWVDCPHIGGVGLLRSSAFTSRAPMVPNGRFGFTEWQQRNDRLRGIPVTGWINPDLLCPQMDLLPIEPWRGLSAGYTEKGWQRAWPPYELGSHHLWDWIPGL
jgi:hypothetical protein